VSQRHANKSRRTHKFVIFDIEIHQLGPKVCLFGGFDHLHPARISNTREEGEDEVYLGDIDTRDEQFKMLHDFREELERTGRPSVGY
jgi:hypothetical protein